MGKKPQLSNEKRVPGCLGYIGDEVSYPLIMWGLFPVSIRIKQPVMF